MWLFRVTHIAYDTYNSHETETTVGHIFGANFDTHAVVTCNNVAHDTYERHETKTHNRWSHFWGNFGTHAFVIYDTYYS